MREFCLSSHTHSLMPSMASLFYPQTPFFPFRTHRLISTPRNPQFSITAVSRGGTEQEILRAVADSEENSLPCVRTFETDSARLALIGSVDFQQALTAAAADGGRAADEHLESSMPAMVVETVFPGDSDERSTVSTRLFLPARKVKEKAWKLRNSLNQDVLSGSAAKNILSMTFRQVVLEQLWSFELVVFKPGVERDMDDLENPREQVSQSSFSLGSSDERVVSALAEAVSVSALKRTEEEFLDKYIGRNPGTILRWFQKPRMFSSKDSSVVVTELFEDEMVEYAKSLLGDFHSAKASFTPARNESKNCGWSPCASSRLEKIGGPRFIAWTNAYVPVYRIQIDSDKLKDVTFEGWRECSDNKWEVLLTHTQMVGLTDVLDMYYEDIYTLPNKELPCAMVKNFTSLPNEKRSSMLLKVLSVTFATGVFIVALSALGQLSFPRIKLGNFTKEHKSLPSLKLEDVLHNTIDEDELELLCIKVIKTILGGLDWGGDIICEPGVGVWTGKLPDYLRLVVEGNSALTPNASSPGKVTDEIKTSAQDIASYQVVLSSDGKVVGFQPTSRVGVNQWAANPLAAELYGGRKLSPSLLEPGLKIPCPDRGVVLIELLMSTKPDARFALARHSL